MQSLHFCNDLSCAQTQCIYVDSDEPDVIIFYKIIPRWLSITLNIITLTKLQNLHDDSRSKFYIIVDNMESKEGKNVSEEIANTEVYA